VASIESDFRENLRLQKNLDEWTEWMEAVVDQLLAPYHDKPIDVLTKASKQFLLKWSFCSSMILRDVTYRTAPSFGSFHLIRLLYDEYMFFLVESRLARATNQPLICVTGGEGNGGFNPPVNGYGKESPARPILNSNHTHSGDSEPELRKELNEIDMPEYENLIDAASSLSNIITTTERDRRDSTLGGETLLPREVGENGNGEDASIESPVRDNRNKLNEVKQEILS